MAFGALMFFCYLKRKGYWIAPLALLGGFLIPGYLPLLGIVLMLFPRGEPPLVRLPRVGWVMGIALGSVIAWAALKMYRDGVVISGVKAEQVHAELLPLSVVALGLQMVVLLGPLFSFWPSPKGAWESLRLRYVPVAIAIPWLIAYAIDRFGSEVIDVTAKAHGQVSLLLGIHKPLASLVAHVSFFGPSFVLLFMLAGAFGRSVWRLGMGMALATGAFFLSFIDSESRHLMISMPLFAAGLAMAFDRVSSGGAKARKRWIFVLAFACLGILSSTVFMPIEKPPLSGLKVVKGYGTSGWQRLFMHVGPWMSMHSFAIVAAFAALSALLLWALGRRWLRFWGPLDFDPNADPQG